MKVLVTGATGRVGANLAQALAKEGHQVRALVNPKSKRASKLDGMDLEVVKADFADYEGIMKAAGGMEAIYHIGAVLGSPGNRLSFKVNLEGTFNMLEAAKYRCPNLTRFVFASTDALYPHSGYIPDPIPEDIEHTVGGIYGVTKECGEIFSNSYYQQYKVPVVIVRFPYILGAGELLSGYFKGLYLQDYEGKCDNLKDLTPEEEEAARAFKALDFSKKQLFIPRMMDGIAYKKHTGDVRDLVDGLLLILEKDEAVGKVMNIVGCPLKWDEVIPYLSEKTGIPYVEAKLPTTPMYYEYSMETAKKVLGFTPKHDYKSMIDAALAFLRGEDIGVIPT